jgi:hypothetical protein
VTPPKILKTGVGALLALSVAGCGAARLPQSHLPDLPESVEGYAALCAAKWQGPEKTWRARVAVAFLPPERIRLEIYDPAGNSRSVLIATEEGALLLDPARRAFRSYPSAQQATRDLVGIAALPQSLARLLLGPAALQSAPQCSAIEAGEEQPQRRCALPGGGELRFGPGDSQRAILTFPGDVSLRLSWGLGAQERSLPRWVEIDQDSPSVQLHLETKEMRFAPPEPEIFSLLAPPGFSPAGEEAIP